MSTTTYFCPHCNSIQETFDHVEGTHLVVRCRRCGYPVEEGIVQKDVVSFQRTKILCIDDDKLLLENLSGLLTANDFYPLTATDGPSGMETAKRERPALILLDILMPGVDGFEACRQFRADPQLKDAPIIILTAMQDPKLTVKAFRAGATLALTKPFEPQQLIRTIKTALALRPKPPTA